MLVHNQCVPYATLPAFKTAKIFKNLKEIEDKSVLDLFSPRLLVSKFDYSQSLLPAFMQP